MSEHTGFVRRWLVPVAVYTVATVYVTWPLARAPATHYVAPTVLGLHDILLVMWIMAWTTHALFVDPIHLFHGNALHPAPYTLATSEHLLGNLPLFGPVWALTGNPLLGLNVVVFASYVLGAALMHGLLRTWTGSTAAAYCGALAFAFAPWRLVPSSPPHLLSAQYLPLLLLLLDRAARTGRGAVVAGLALGMQALCSYYLGYMAYLTVAAYVAVWALGFGVRGHAASWRAIGATFAVSALAIAPVTAPYVLAQARGALAPDPSVAEVFGRLSEPAHLIDAHVGRTAIALAALGALALPSAWRTDRLRGVRIGCLLAITVAAFLLARGPVGVLDGRLVPWDWLAAVVPGFRNFRVTFRFGTLAAFGASGLAAFAVAAACRLSPARLAHVVGAVAVVAVALPVLRSTPAVGHPLRTGASVPSAYHWLAEHGDRDPLLEVPVQPNPAGARAMYYSTYHWLPLLNGYTGHLPPSLVFLMTQAEQLPSPETLRLMVACTGLRWILVHRASAERRDGWSTVPGLERRAVFTDGEFGDDWLYEVTDRSPPGCAGGLRRPDVTAAGRPLVVPTTITGQVSVDGLRSSLPAGGESAVRVTLRNDGDQSWPGTALQPSGRFVLRARWLGAGGRPLPTPQRILLPGDVGPGETLGFTAWVHHPRHPGQFTLEVTAGGESGVDAAPLAWRGTTTVQRPDVP
jgi:hypothetical protein